MDWLPLPDLAAGLELLLRATLLLGVAWASAAALRKIGASAAARHMAWLFAIAALLALPFLWSLAPALRLPVLPAEAASVAAAAPAGLAGPVSPGSPDHPSWSLIILAAYALGASALLARLAVGCWKLARIWREAGPAGEAAWQTLLTELSSELRLSRRIELRIAPGPAMPMTWGTLAPKLLLPAEASSWRSERRRLVLLHELAHVARRDSLSRSLASLACALYWFHPGAWLAARQLRIEQEHAADDRVLTAGGSAQAYARDLLHLARTISGRSQPELAATMAGMCQLERRLVSITSPARRDRPGGALLASSAMLAALATLIVAAAIPVSPPSTPIGPFQASRGDIESALETRAETPSAAQAGSSEAPGRPAGDETVASDAPARPRVFEGAEGPAPRVETVAREDGQGSAEAQSLPDYGWQLPRRDPSAELAALGDPSARARFDVPNPLHRNSRERATRPKWPANVPRLVVSAPTSGPGPPDLSGRQLTLSWSLEAH